MLAPFTITNVSILSSGTSLGTFFPSYRGQRLSELSSQKLRAEKRGRYQRRRYCSTNSRGNRIYFAARNRLRRSVAASKGVASGARRREKVRNGINFHSRASKSKSRRVDASLDKPAVSAQTHENSRRYSRCLRRGRLGRPSSTKGENWEERLRYPRLPS